MADTTPYVRSYSFTNYQADVPDQPLPGNRIDIELDNIADKSRVLTDTVNAGFKVDANLEDIVAVADEIDKVVFVADNMPDVRNAADVAPYIERASEVFLGAFPEDPSTGVNGDPIIVGATYYNTVLSQSFVWTGGQWVPLAQISIGGVLQGSLVVTDGDTSFTIGDFVSVTVALNGQVLRPGTEFTAISPTITIPTAVDGDEVTWFGVLKGSITDAAAFVRQTLLTTAGVARYALNTSGQPLNLTPSNHILFGAAPFAVLTYGVDYIVDAGDLVFSFSPAANELYHVFSMPRFTNTEAQAVLQDLEDRVSEYADRAEATVSKRPQDFGGVGNGTADDFEAFRQMFLAGGDIYIPEGRWRIAQFGLRLVSDTNVVCHPDAIVSWEHLGPWNEGALFVNGISGTTDGPGGYDGVRNFTWTGGTITGEVRADAGLLTALFNLSHGSGYRFRGVRFHKYAGNTHFVDLAGMDDVLFEDCVFDTWVPNGTAPGTREAVNVDCATATGFPEFGPWDDTPSRNIRFIRCTTINCDVGFGCHHGARVGAQGPHDILVEGCKFLGSVTRGVQFRWCDRVIERNCYHEGGAAGSQMRACRWSTMDGSVYHDLTSSQSAFIGEWDSVEMAVGNIMRGLRATGTAGQFLFMHQFGGVCCDNYYSGSQSGFNEVLNIGGSNECEFEGNRAATRRRIYSDMSVSPNPVPGEGSPRTNIYNRIEGAYYARIVDDSAIRLPPPANMGQGQVDVSAQSALTNQPSGLAYVRCNSGELSSRKVVDFNGDSFSVSTGPLTGTTGANDRTTLSADVNAVAVENRSGITRTYRLDY